MKLVYILLLSLFLLLSCDKNDPISQNDDNQDDPNQNYLDQIDDLFTIKGVTPPNDWKIKMVTYKLRYNDDAEWSEKEIEYVSYFLGEGDFFQSQSIYDQSKMWPLPWPNLFYHYYDGTQLIIPNVLGVPLACYDINYVEKTNNIKFGDDCYIYNYNEFLKIEEASRIAYMENDPVTSTYEYNSNQLIKITGSNGSTRDYVYGNDGMIKKYTSSFDNKIQEEHRFEHNQLGYRTKEWKFDGSGNERQRSEFSYENNIYTEIRYSSTYTVEFKVEFRDPNYKNILAAFRKNEGQEYEMTGSWEYGQSYLIYRGDAFIRYNIDSQDRVTETIYTNVDGIPSTKYVNTYYYR